MKRTKSASPTMSKRVATYYLFKRETIKFIGSKKRISNKGKYRWQLETSFTRVTGELFMAFVQLTLGLYHEKRCLAKCQLFFSDARQAKHTRYSKSHRIQYIKVVHYSQYTNVQTCLRK